MVMEASAKQGKTILSNSLQMMLRDILPICGVHSAVLYRFFYQATYYRVNKLSSLLEISFKSKIFENIDVQLYSSFIFIHALCSNFILGVYVKGGDAGKMN